LAVTSRSGSTACWSTTNVLTDDTASRDQLASVRALAQRRGSLFLTVMVTCDTDVQVSRIDNPDRIALRKGSDPEGYRRWRPCSGALAPGVATGTIP
jgi:hypothetical protein